MAKISKLRFVDTRVIHIDARFRENVHSGFKKNDVIPLFSAVDRFRLTDLPHKHIRFVLCC
jgi:hypothetical protein